MRYVKWSLIAVLVLTVFGFFHYTLPQHDVVRIVNTEIRRVDFGFNAFFYSDNIYDEQGAVKDRDVRFIEAFYEDESPMIYRNEDTGWGWPPYFKVDTSNLQALAQDLVSTKSQPQWVVVTHYGWRNEFWSIYPNAVEIRAVDSPDPRIIPWVNIVILTLLAGLVLWLWRVWVRFRERRIDPMLDEASVAWDDFEDRTDAATERARGAWDRFKRWLSGLGR